MKILIINPPHEAIGSRMPGEMLDYGRVLTVLKQGVALDGAARTKTTGKI